MIKATKKILSLLSPNLLEEPFSFLSSSSKSLRRFHNIHKGEKCFIIGNGPSLNQIDLTLLGDSYTFGVNGIFYKTVESGFRPYYYVVEDVHVMNDNKKTIVDYAPRDGGAKFVPARHRFSFIGSNEHTYFLNMNRGYYDKHSSHFEFPRFSADISGRVYCGQSVTIINLQLAYYMGFSVVYLLGMDFSYQIPSTAVRSSNVILSQDEDPNHFHPEYFGKGKRWHDPKLGNVAKSYRLCRLMYELDGRAIINATPGGKLDIFPRLSYSDALEGLFPA